MSRLKLTVGSAAGKGGIHAEISDHSASPAARPRSEDRQGSLEAESRGRFIGSSLAPGSIRGAGASASTWIVIFNRRFRSKLFQSADWDFGHALARSPSIELAPRKRNNCYIFLALRAQTELLGIPARQNG